MNLVVVVVITNKASVQGSSRNWRVVKAQCSEGSTISRLDVLILDAGVESTLRRGTRDEFLIRKTADGDWENAQMTPFPVRRGATLKRAPRPDEQNGDHQRINRAGPWVFEHKSEVSLSRTL